MPGLNPAVTVLGVDSDPCLRSGRDVTQHRDGGWGAPALRAGPSFKAPLHWHFSSADAAAGGRNRDGRLPVAATPPGRARRRPPPRRRLSQCAQHITGMPLPVRVNERLMIPGEWRARPQPGRH